ncbi:MAG: hypothetical protein RR515_06190 [Clostridium sp.]
MLHVDGIDFYIDEGVEDFPSDIKIFKDEEKFGGSLTAKYTGFSSSCS